MASDKRKRRKKIRKKDIRLFILMCAIAAAIGALLTMFYGNGGDVRGMLTERLIQEYRHQTGKPGIDPATRPRIAATVEKAPGGSDR